MPQMIKNAMLLPGQSLFVRKGKLLVCAFKQRAGTKMVRVLSTYHSAKEGVSKPEIVEHYQKYMGGVDTNDMMTSFYGDDRKTLKMWKKVFFNFCQRIVLNAFILYKKHTADSKPMTRLQFTESVIESLTANHRAPHGLDDRHHLLRSLQRLPIGKRKDCTY